MLALPRLSLAERDRRWRLVREKMAEQGIDCLLVWGAPVHWDMKVSSARYLTQIGGNGEFEFVVFPRAEEPTVFIWANTFLSWWQEAQDWIQDIRVRRPGWAEAVAGRVRELGLERGRLGVVGLSGLFDRDGYLPYETYLRLQQLLPDAQFLNATALLEECRMVKSAEEVAMLERAAAIGDAMMEAYVSRARPGVRECEVYAAVFEALIAHGGEVPTLVLMGSGPAPHPHPFYHPTQRYLEHGDTLIAEMHPKYGGYLAHMERTVSLGPPHPHRRYLYEVTMQCYQAALEALRPGQFLSEIQSAIRRPIAEARLAFTECGIHGHGLESLEYPTFLFPPEAAATELVEPQAIVGDGRLKEGMVVGLIIDLVDPNWEGGRTGTVFGDTLVIEATGARRLSRFPLGLAVV